MIDLPRSNPVAAKLRKGEPTFGTWITLSPHPRTVAILAAAGFEFVIIEMEHTDFDHQTVGALSMLARASGIAPIVRPAGTASAHTLTRPLDAGAQGLLLPNVESAEEAERLVRWTKYHPRGGRIMNLKGPHTDYADRPAAELIEHVNRETIMVAMIETRRGIDALPEICKVDGIDAIMIGPDDLSQDLGVPSQMNAPVMQEAVAEIFAICKAHNMPFGQSAHNGEAISGLVAKGATWLPYSNDAAMVLNAARQAVPAIRTAIAEGLDARKGGDA